MESSNLMYGMYYLLISAEQGELQGFGRLHEQVITVGQRRLELILLPGSRR